MVNKIIEIAQLRGSTARTHAGAKRWLLAHLPAPIPGLKNPSGGHRAESSCYLTKEAYLRKRFRHRIEARADRMAADLGLPSLASVERKLEASFRLLLTPWPYARARTAWAGGDHFVSVHLAEEVAGAFCRPDKVWSNNGKWSGTNTHASLFITLRALNEFGPNNLLQGGLITLDAEKVGPREYRAVWAVQSRGYNLRTQEGWIIKGYHSTASSLEKARAEAAQARAKALEEAMRRRARKLSEAQEIKTLNRVWVTLEDSFEAGNCKPASENVRRRACILLGGDVFAVRGDFLLNLVTESERCRAWNAVRKAASRMGVTA